MDRVRTAGRFVRAPLAVLAAVLLLAAGGRYATANDSTARLDIGGLVFTHSPSLEMAEEDLYLSRDEVRVRYLFKNVSDADVATLVAFPLPPLVIDVDTNYSVDARDPINFVGFEVAVDGKPVDVKTQLRATRFGVDVTDVLRRHDIPVTMMTVDPDDADVLYQRLNTLPPEARRDLEAHGVMDWSSAWGAKDEPLATPHWTAELAFYWQQTFPARSSIEVTHRYRPVPSTFFLAGGNFEDAKFNDSFCIDDDFKRAVVKRAETARYGVLNGYELRYVLTTAKYWLGPIGRFTLTVDKGAPDALVSLCIDGIEKTGPTTFVHTARDFSPEKDLDVLFAAPAK